jgi:hypothetical protein
MRWEHRATRFGEAAAPRGVDSAQRSVGDQARSGVGGRGGVRAASDVCRVESGDLRAGARERKTICVVWEGMLPERRDVEVKERKRMGGEWVKQPKGAKGLKIWRPQEIQGKVRVVCSLSWQRNCSDLLQQGSRANLKLCHPSCRGIFHDLAGIRVRPVELSCVVLTRAVDLGLLLSRAGRLPSYLCLVLCCCMRLSCCRSVVHRFLVVARLFRPGLGPVILPRVFTPGLPACLRSLRGLALVVVSESPDSPVDPAVSGEGVVRVDSCVRLVPST